MGAVSLQQPTSATTAWLGYRPCPTTRGTSTRNTEPSTADTVWTQLRNKPTREEASRTSEAAMFEQMWRSRHQVAYQALAVIGQHHPDKKTAKAARATLHKASSARLPTAPAASWPNAASP
jgi:hypothetical protein